MTRSEPNPEELLNLSSWTSFVQIRLSGSLLESRHHLCNQKLSYRLRFGPGLRARDLVELASAITRKGGPDEFDFSYSGYELGIVARHPDDDGVWLGGHRRAALGT